LLKDGNGKPIVLVATPDEISVNSIMEVMGDVDGANELKIIQSML
jgi:hypothetical protein